MNFDVTILGSSSAIHAHDRFPSAQIVHYNNQPYLIDCGEGTQFRLSQYKIKSSRINQIFISHLHGDHYYGLIGLLASMNLVGRKEKLTIYAPEGVEDIIQVNTKYSLSEWKYPIEYIILETTRHQRIFENQQVEVFTIPLEHKIPTCGFLFVEKPKLKNVIKEKLEQYGIAGEKILEIKNGANFVTESGVIIPNEELTLPQLPLRKYAYCSDTRFAEHIIPIVEGVDLLYHEATYQEAEAEKAKEFYHSTAAEAAGIATKANVKSLLIGHFSSRYENLDRLLGEAAAVFPKVALAHEGDTIDIPYSSGI